MSIHVCLYLCLGTPPTDQAPVTPPAPPPVAVSEPPAQPWTVLPRYVSTGLALTSLMAGASLHGYALYQGYRIGPAEVVGHGSGSRSVMLRGGTQQQALEALRWQ